MKSVLVTGANGFIGSALMLRLAGEAQIRAIAGLRTPATQAGSWQQRVSGNLAEGMSNQSLLSGVDVVVHAAARAHIMKDKVADPLAEFRRVNVDGTLNLARQAAATGVRRFIFISSIGVNGNSNRKPFTVTDKPLPAKPYALSKWEAEQGLWRIQRETGIELVIIRPPLVYGPRAKGNFARMIKLIDKGVPLPLGAIHNQRSLVGIDNLVDLIIRCIDHPAAANRVFLAGDGEDLSTTELLRTVGKAMGRPARLIPVPAALLNWGAAVLGKQDVAERLLGSLQVDISQTCELLDWRPPLTVEQGLQKCFEGLPKD